MERKKREAHSKSRRGCQNCKKRHVKCDEQGPPCANCIVRKLSCVYQSPPDSTASSSTTTSLTRRPKKTPRSDPPECSSDSSSVVNSTLSMAHSPVSSLTSSPTTFSSIPESHRLLELELMHRWTTRTYMGLCSVPEDQQHLQNYLPRAALRTSYLMNGILALSALELARASGTPATYLPAAIEYSNRASADFRSQLCNITQENLHLLYCFGMIAATFNFALPPEQMSAMDRMGIAFDMVLGASNLAMTNMQWIIESPISVGVVLSYGTTTMDIVDLKTRIALDRLTSVSRQMTPKLIPAAKVEDQDAGQAESVDGGKEMYWLAIAQLKYCFAEDARSLIKGYCLTLIPIAGPEFISAIRKLEPVALFILMYFGVLFDRYGEDPRMWWITSTGRDLVKEISEMLLRSSIADIPDGREGIAWTRQQVGLPPLALGIDDCLDPSLLVL